MRVVFSLDCHDREVLSYRANSKGLTSDDVCSLMTQSIESRFGLDIKLPNEIQWLSDNGPQFTSKQTLQFAKDLGLLPCTTPAYSPESNGMAEAFVKTFKRDYVYVSSLESAEKVLAQIPEWFRDYNENAPHKGLKMKAPTEYREEMLAV